MHAIRAIRPKPGKMPAFALWKEWSAQMRATPGEAQRNKTHFSGFVGCQGIVCSSPRGVRDLVMDLGRSTSASKTMLAAC